jgi:hypothetical protein
MSVATSRTKEATSRGRDAVSTGLFVDWPSAPRSRSDVRPLRSLRQETIDTLAGASREELDEVVRRTSSNRQCSLQRVWCPYHRVAVNS